MSLLQAWVLFPFALVLLAAGWGLLVRRASGAPVPGVLILPLGAATIIVVAGICTSFEFSARAAVPVVALGAAVGLWLGWRDISPARAPAVAALGTFLAFGAPVILSGKATFAGYIRLDDTATWFAFVAQVMTHGRSLAHLPDSTYSLVLHTNLDPGYPLGAFMLPGVGRAFAGLDVAWILQPTLAVCAALVSLPAYALVRRLVDRPWLAAVCAAIASQSALLYGYSLWGGIKELTAAFLVVLGAAVVTTMLPAHRGSPRELLPLGIVAAALAGVFGPSGALFVLPLAGGAAICWTWRARAAGRIRDGLVRSVWLGVIIAVLAVPMWLILSKALKAQSHFAGDSGPGSLGNLIQPLSVWQAGGIWPTGDFRLRVDAFPTTPLLVLVGTMALAALWVTVRRREFGLSVYLGIALVGYLGIWLPGGSGWVTGKALAIASPAVPLAALVGAALLFTRQRVVGAAALVLIVGGVTWSNAMAYHDVQLAPRDRLAELEHVNDVIAGKGPTFVSEYEIYADRYFLNAGAPVVPAEYRNALLPLLNGDSLIKSAHADLDSFAPQTLLPYRSIVTRRSPVASRPPSMYELKWRGTYYEVWQREAAPTRQVVERLPLGDTNEFPYCGLSTAGVSKPFCSIAPAAVAPCPAIRALGQKAARMGGHLVAGQRPVPIVARAEQSQWPGAWPHLASGSIQAVTPGTLTMQIQTATPGRYELWLGGSFARGFQVSVDGRRVGSVKNELQSLGQYVQLPDLTLAPGIHKFRLRAGGGSLAPSNGAVAWTTLDAVALVPVSESRLISTTPADAGALCGRSLDWIEIVSGP